MKSRKDENPPTPPDDDMQELSGFPDYIRQIDLAEIIRLRYRLRLVKEELASMEAQIKAQITLGLPVEEGRLTVRCPWGDGRFEIRSVEEKER